ncbi:MAG: hypothetical protein WC869_10345 [Phycisphaerae bacterium]|jgi:hypothetical protein
MRALAYCAYQFREIARRVVGSAAAVLTSPPYGEELPPPLRAILNPHVLPPRFLYLDLHMRRAGEGAFYGDDGRVALTVAMVRPLQLRGAVVFATTCFLADGGPMLDALLSTGAGVMAGPGKNLGGGRRALLGADLLALWVRRLLALGFSPAAALELGKRRLQLRREKTAAVLDALQFRLFEEGV